MPRFYFHLRTPTGLERDEIGVDLADVEAAYLDAHRTISPLAAELARQGVVPLGCSFEIVDAAGTPLMEVPFSEALDAPRTPRPPARSLEHRARAEMQRTVHLTAALQAERLALRATLDETKRLLAEARRFCRAEPREAVPGPVPKRRRAPGSRL